MTLRLTVTVAFSSLLFLASVTEAHAVTPAGAVEVEGEMIPIPGMVLPEEDAPPPVDEVAPEAFEEINMPEDEVPAPAAVLERVPWESGADARRGEREAAIGMRQIPPAPALPPEVSSPEIPAAPIHSAAPSSPPTTLPRTGVPEIALFALSSLAAALTPLMRRRRGAHVVRV